MSSKVITAGLFPPPIHSDTRWSKSMLLEPRSSSHLSFTTNLINQESSLSIKTLNGYGSGSSRGVKKVSSSSINAFYAPPQTRESFYDLLGISESVSLSEIKTAYRQLARKYHPDVSPPDRTEEYTRRFIQVQEAYQTLSDPLTRAMYDRDLAQSFHLPYSAKTHKRSYVKEGEEWKSIWLSQLVGLKQRGMNKDSRRNWNMTWGARMRSRRSENFDFGCI